MTNEATDTLVLSCEPPALAPDISQITIYHDGSGKATDELERNLRMIQEREDVLKLLKLFIAKHRCTLAGLHWSVEYLDPEITLAWRWYRREKATPAQIANLWPGAEWKRVKPRYDYEDNPKPQRDWMATVDGVRLRIERAEVFEIPTRPKLPREGSRAPIKGNES